jgi:hypothetical protein
VIPPLLAGALLLCLIAFHNDLDLFRSEKIDEHGEINAILPDLILRCAGWKVLRFTSSEICADWEACAAHIDLLAAKEIDAQLEQLRR